LILFLLLLSQAFALDVAEYPENGLKVLVLEDHKAPTATQIWYRWAPEMRNIPRQD
jgi:hypothetical protein